MTALAHRHPAQENPIVLTTALIAAALAAVGVVGFAAGAKTRRETKEAGKSPVGPGQIGIFKAALVEGGGASTGTPDDDYTMRHGGLFTTWFTRDVEQEVRSRLQAYKNKHNVTTCTAVHGTRPGIGSHLDTFDYLKYFKEAEAATREILTDLWPDGRPWDGEQFALIWTPEEAETGYGGVTTPVHLWRWWTWNRVNDMAAREVCGWRPVT